MIEPKDFVTVVSLWALNLRGAYSKRWIERAFQFVACCLLARRRRNKAISDSRLEDGTFIRPFLGFFGRVEFLGGEKLERSKEESRPIFENCFVHVA
jgi:hypothetical protein